jgi:Hg(II)-responsive transcriptional regulator
MNGVGQTGQEQGAWPIASIVRTVWRRTMPGSLTIGEVADRASVNVQTIRYYERRGLLPDPPRSSSGYRQYSSDNVARIRFIKRAQALGFSLNDISELLALRVDPSSNCEEVLHRAEIKLVDIDEKVDALRRMRRSLESLTTACRDQRPTGECPILEALEA